MNGILELQTLLRGCLSHRREILSFDQKFFNKTSEMIKSLSVRGTKNEAKPSARALLCDLRVEKRLRSSNVQVSVEILIASHVAAVDLF